MEKSLFFPLLFFAFCCYFVLFFLPVFVRVIANPDRQFAVWLGAKIFCAPGTRRMQDLLWITKDDWYEEGAAVVAKRVRDPIYILL